MSNDIKITDAVTKKGNLELVVEHGGEKFVYSQTGLKPFADHGVKVEALTGAKADFIKQGALVNLASGKDLPTKVKEALPKASELFAGSDQGLLDIVEKKAALMTAAKSGTVAEIEAAANALPKGESVKSVLTEDLLAKAEKTGFKLTEFEEAATKAATKLKNSETAVADIKKLIDAKAKPADINKKLLEHHEHFDDIAKLESHAGYDLQGAIASHRQDIASKVTEVSEHYADYAKHKSAHQLALGKGETEAAKAAEEAAEKALKNAKAITGGDHGKAVSSALPKDLKELVGLHNPAEAKLLGIDGLAAAGKSKWYNLTKTAGELAEKNFKPEQLKGIKGLWNNRTFTGKAALVGIPTVAVAYMAGIGGKGKHTEQVAAQQLNAEQGVGVA